ncbi:NlpC/P60 family protein [uncultured Photobacterium sp.]|uniref:NlpC/P60 family protein n=1 Tax=uncultured Photobacterium sp. TaxID=173973 RepID=UPI00262E9B74|nr:NlpC/P60 family protein [uncultured Photobacterium sp.]
MKKYLFWAVICVFLMVLSGCASAPSEEKKSEFEGIVREQNKNTVSPGRAALFNVVYESWKGTPYRLGGSNKRGIDCSAFVQVGYSTVFNLKLPRTTGELVKMGQWIPLVEAEEGDLVFFKTGRRLRHVGIYLGNFEFLHASTSRGVIISRLDNPYWRGTFWQARRVRML